MIATTTADVVHYFLAPNPGSTPVRGGEHLGRYWRKVHAMIGAVWVVDHGIAQGDEAVTEWSMFWTPQGHDGFAYDDRGYSTHDAVRSHRHSPVVAR